MDKLSILSKRKILALMVAFSLAVLGLMGRVFYIQVFRAEELQEMAYEQQTRDRLIKPNRGSIYDRNMMGIAKTETVASISVIHAQITDEEQTARVLSEKLDLSYDYVLEKTKKNLALERIMTKVDKDIADEIRALEIPGVVVDEDIRRVYPYSSLASQVIGFAGKDNQGIIGLEAKYDEYLMGESGKILTETDAGGRQIANGQSERIPPEDGNHLVTTIDVIVQQYAEQTIKKAVEAKGAARGAIILMNPQNGEIYAMANEPNFDLNDPFTINSDELLAVWDTFTSEEQSNYLNQMWRNFSINDTYEPGSTFKIITSVAGLEEGVVTPESTFDCHAGRTVGGRLIRCWRSPRSHGVQTFVEGVQNSCNPVFMDIAEQLGAEAFYSYIEKLGFKEKTGIDLPGEAVGIFHELDNVGPVELATMSFGQSFQITPLQLLRAASASVNGGYLVTPHLASKIIDAEGNIVEEFHYDNSEQVISEENSKIMREILESVVSTGTGSKTYIPGYRVGGKTATSEKLPRKSGKYIASFLAFAPAEDPQVMALVLIDEPQGAYYGGQVAGPVMKEIMENVLPYLRIEPEYTEEEKELPETQTIVLPDMTGYPLSEVQKDLNTLGLVYEIIGDGDLVTGQFPLMGDTVNVGSKIILYVEQSPDDENSAEDRGETLEGRFSMSQVFLSISAVLPYNMR